MKKHAIKFLIPAFAIVFAVVASAFTVKDNDFLDGNNMISGEYYLDQNNPCEPIQVECDLDNQKICKYGSEDVYLAGTNCTFQLKRP